MRSRSNPSGAVQRARIILLASQGESNSAIAELVGVSRPTVISWRARYDEDGLAGLEDDPRSGRPRSLDHGEIVSAILMPPPKKYGVTNWSSRLLATHLGIGYGTVARIWREYGVHPWCSETFKFSIDPELVATLEIETGKVTGICWLRHRHQEFLVVLKHVARAYPKQELHLVMDNYATHKKAESVSGWRRNPRPIHADVGVVDEPG